MAHEFPGNPKSVERLDLEKEVSDLLFLYPQTAVAVPPEVRDAKYLKVIADYDKDPSDENLRKIADTELDYLLEDHGPGIDVGILNDTQLLALKLRAERARQNSEHPDSQPLPEAVVADLLGTGLGKSAVRESMASHDRSDDNPYAISYDDRQADRADYGAARYTDLSQTTPSPVKKPKRKPSKSVQNARAIEAEHFRRYGRNYRQRGQSS